jgi:hypothetical protein
MPKILRSLPRAADTLRSACLATCLLLPLQAGAVELRPKAVGVRYGQELNLSGEHVEVQRADLFTVFPLRWDGDWGRRWRWRSGLEVSFGHFSGDSDANAIALGPSLIAQRVGSRFGLEIGFQLTHLSESVIGARDTGRHTHCTSHISLLAALSSHWIAGYRLQHISNASTRGINPGLNTHMIELRYQF